MNEKKRQTNQLQARYLRDRLQSAFGKKRSEIYAREESVKEPAAVRAARKVVEDWDRQKRKASRAAHDTAIRRLSKDREAVQEKLLFAAPEVALKAVQDFEARQF